MSRLIDADALIREYPIRLDHYDEEHGNIHFIYGIESVMEYVDLMPTIDAVEVVRCKDCKDIFFDDWYKCFSCANLYGLNEEVKPDDYCSHGERKESE